ncbi:effector-associated constant component EACC1 [Actinokineospora diospyrosa]|uniref:Uncharacterized protein n=1 Tax=Actinokineospora diospyrosa TaxID=103728 RepID=A0ABT1I8Y1_9PSEU|nr:hypothetical protein [Actinokineospora diospyrosa]MCP2269082.1 hypothetical protein [Actinokineospora diospyrosa]
MKSISVHVHGADEAEADGLTRQLRAELLELDVDAVDFGADEAPPAHSKGVDPGVVTTLVVAVSSSPVLVELARAVRDWITRATDRKLTITAEDGRTLEITGARAREDQRLIESFLNPEGDRPELTP